MKKTKIIIKNKTTLQSNEKFIEETEKKINEYINNGYEIKASNLNINGNFAYIYVLLEKEVV